MKLEKKNNKEILKLVEHRVETKDGATCIVPTLHFPLLDQTGIVEHCFSTRMGGVSEGEFSSMNFSFTRGDEPEAVLENYRRIAHIMGAKLEDIVCSDQTHTTNVRQVGKADGGKGVTRERGYTDVDGLITNEPGVLLATFYADCVPLYFVDPVHKAIGLSHSGWRGTVGRMGQKTLETMKEAYGTNPEDVYAAIGPSICQDCYEISADVAEHFYREFLSGFSKYVQDGENPILIDKGNGKYQLDLWKTNEIIMLEAGILPEHLTVTNICTCCNAKLLFSHRASKGKRGNLGAFLMLKP